MSFSWCHTIITGFCCLDIIWGHQCYDVDDNFKNILHIAACDGFISWVLGRANLHFQVSWLFFVWRYYRCLQPVLPIKLSFYRSFQCFDTVDWTTETHSSLFLDPKASLNATVVVLVLLVVISSLKMPNTLLMHSATNATKLCIHICAHTRRRRRSTVSHFQLIYS